MAQKVVMSAMYGAVLMLAAAPQLAAAAISQGYQSDESLSPGTVVSLRESDHKVVPADITNDISLLGVVVGSAEATLNVASPTDKVQVSTVGVVDAFVSSLGGDIKTGDPVTVSPVRGVGMKAGSAGRIIGIAQEEAKYSDRTVNVQAKAGGSVKAKLGSVPVAVQVSYYTPPPEKTVVPPWLQTFADTAAGREVSLIRLLASSLVAVIALIVTTVLLFSAIRNTMVSIGRNPLAKTSIYRGLWQVIAISVVVVVSGFMIAYLLLRL